MPVLVGVCAMGAPILVQMARYALLRSLYSHVFLIPLISGLLIYRRRDKLKAEGVPSPVLTLCLLSVSLGALLLAGMTGISLTPPDELSLRMFAFVVLLLAAINACGGSAVLRQLSFPLFFLFFMVPMPQLLEAWFGAALVRGTAAVLTAMLTMTGTPFVNEGTTFMLPGLTIEIASECSGIRSSFVLLISGILIGEVMLTTCWRKLVLASLFYPLGIIRNAFRILLVVLLTIHVDPGIIEGPLHRRGGPLFFAMFLVPLFLITWWFVRSERKASPARLDVPGQKE